MNNADQPINPFIPQTPWDNESASGFMGLTKREHFAIEAMIGIISSTRGIGLEINDKHIEIISKKSVKYADALLKELSKK